MGLSGVYDNGGMIILISSLFFCFKIYIQLK